MIKGFNPIISKEPIIMILGSAPSVKSLQENQYYGNKRNSFWKILANIFEYKNFENYEEKKSFISNNNIILWDVIKTCSRQGSLDSQIQDVIVNEIEEMINKYPSLKLIIFNGKKSYTLYKKHINYFPNNIKFINLPSTSPAYTLSFEKKLEEWKKNISHFI